MGRGNGRRRRLPLSVSSPNYLTDVFTLIRGVTAYNLRNSDKNLVLQKPNTEYLKNSVCYRGAKIWNSPFPKVKAAQSFESFKKSFRAFGPGILNNVQF